MKRLLLVLSCALFFASACPAAGNSIDVRFWHRNHKDSSKTTDASTPKEKRGLLHRIRPSREQAAHSEATYGMTGPKSIGWRHAEPGPAGYGAR